MEHGFWYARAEEYIQGSIVQMLTWARILGGLLFVFGGVIPGPAIFSQRLFSCRKELKALFEPECGNSRGKIQGFIVKKPTLRWAKFRGV